MIEPAVLIVLVVIAIKLLRTDIERNRVRLGYLRLAKDNEKLLRQVKGLGTRLEIMEREHDSRLVSSIPLKYVSEVSESSTSAEKTSVAIPALTKAH